MKYVADDIWFEIFLRLPVNAIFRFKSVNMVWFSTLSCPNFISKWYKFNYVSLPWVLVQHAFPADDGSRDYNNRLSRRFTISYPDSQSQFIENHQNGFSFSFLNRDFPNGNNDKERTNLYLMGSSNGLVLCCIKSSNQETCYCVCNPLTQKWVSIPPPPPTTKHNFLVTGFMCNDECFSSSLGPASFKVVKIPKFGAAVKEFKVEMFFSESGEWNVYDVLCAQDVTWNISHYDNPITHNGVFYWLQKANSKILAVSIDGNRKDGTCGCECRLINLPDQAMDDDLNLRHRLGESEGSICYAIIKEKERSLSVWVLEDEWCLLYKDNKFHDMLTEMESLLNGEIGKTDLITQLRILDFNPVDRNVVILGYDKYIWAYNTRTKECEQLSHPSFLRIDGYVSPFCFFTFALKPRPSILPPVSWADTSMLDVQV